MHATAEAPQTLTLPQLVSLRALIEQPGTWHVGGRFHEGERTIPSGTARKLAVRGLARSWQPQYRDPWRIEVTDAGRAAYAAATSERGALRSVLDAAPTPDPDPIPHIELLEDVRVRCEGCGTDAYQRRGDVLLGKTWTCLSCGRLQPAKVAS